MPRQKGIMEDSLTSVYLTHLLLKLQIAELDYREAVEFAFNYSHALKTVERLGLDLQGSWSTVCRNGKALIVHFRDPEFPAKGVRYITGLSRRHVLTVVPLEDELGREVQLDLMTIERVEVPVLSESEEESDRGYSLAGIWPE